MYSRQTWGIEQFIVSERLITTAVFERLRQATASNPEVLAELCRDYIFEARATISQIRDALEHGDAAQLRERAHYLKGSSMMIGAQQLSGHCGALEQMGRDSQLATAGAELERTVAALKSVESELEQEFGPAVLPQEGSAA